MSNAFDLRGKLAAVTGSGSGIGAGIAKALAAHGARVALLDISPEGAEGVMKEIAANGGDAFYVSCDVSDFSSVKSAFSKVAEAQPLDILVNNAGVAHIGNVDTTSPEDFDRIYGINVKGVFHCLKAGIPLMKENGGSILNLSSIAAQVGLEDRFAYSMSKGAVHAMTLSVAKDYIACGIRCNCIAPARVHTPFVDDFIAKNYPGKEAETLERLAQSQPIGRMARSEEIGALALYLCSDEASFITGNSYPIDGGFLTLNT